MKKRILLLAAALCLLCSGCGGGLLEREWSSVTPHSAGYWENGDKDTLRADSYQDAVNAILMLVANHADRLVVRVSYLSTDRAGVEQMVRDVQEEKGGGRDAGMLAAPWQVSFYPDTDEPGIVEILLK